MAEQLELPLGHISSRQFDPVASVRAHLGSGESALDHVQVDPARGFATAQAYKAASAAPSEAPGIRQSYEAMRQETHAQYAHMTGPKESGGLGLRHEITDTDPYPTAQHMADDVRGGTIKTLSTAATGGHAHFSDEDNDKFRAVHDVFGHAATGRGFSRHGEEAAYLSHRQMFSPKAQQAVASETRGQNSYFNFGATQEHPEKSFPDQSSKLVGLPKFAQETGKVRSPRSTSQPQGEQGQLL